MTIQNFEGHGAPGVTIVGEVGDLYTDLDTGKVYQCSMVYRYAASQSLDGVTHEYVWKEKEEGGSGGGVSSWNDLTDKPFYDTSKTFNIGKEAYDSENENNATIVYDNDVERTFYYLGNIDMFSNMPNETEIILQSESLEFADGTIEESGYRFTGIVRDVEDSHLHIISNDANFDIFQVFADNTEVYTTTYDGYIKGRITFPKAGIYISVGLVSEGQYNDAYVYIKTIGTIGEIVQLDPKFIPSDYVTREETLELIDDAVSSGGVQVAYAIDGYLYSDREGEEQWNISTARNAVNSGPLYIVDPSYEFESKMLAVYIDLYTTTGPVIKYFDPSSTDTFKLLTATVVADFD